MGRPAEAQQQDQGPAEAIVEEIEDAQPTFNALEAFSIITGSARTQLPPYPILRNFTGAGGSLQPNGIHADEAAGDLVTHPHFTVPPSCLLG